MKEILVRTLTGGVFVISVIGSMLWHPLAFFAVMGIYTTIGLHEFYRMTIPHRNHFLYIVAGLALYALVALVLLSYLEQHFLLLTVPLFFLIMIIELFNKNGSWKNLAFYLLAYLYIALPFGLLNAFFYLNSPQIDFTLPVSLFVLVWINDIFAYLSGTFFGRHKLFERVSPKKTWEGALGGLAFAMTAAWAFSQLSELFTLPVWLLYAALLVVTATFGDLVESMLKRNMGVKDSGTIFPGHGGVLDRFDAVLFAAPFAYVFLIFVTQ